MLSVRWLELIKKLEDKYQTNNYGRIKRDRGFGEDQGYK